MDGDIPTPVSEMTPEAAEAEIHSVQIDRDHPYWSDNHPGKDAAQERMTALYEVKAGAVGGASGTPDPADIEDADTGISTSPEFRQTIEDAMAAPETPDGYDFEDTKVKFGDDANWDGALESQMRPLFHAAGLSDTEANGLLNTFIEVQRSTPEQHEKMAVNTRITLQQRWGDDYNANMTVAANAAKKLGGENLISFLDNTGAGDHWNVIETLYRVGKRMGV